MTKLKHLFEPVSIGSLKLKNRLVMSPMATNYGSSDGFVTEQLKEYYATRARGGVGLVIVEATCVDAPTGRGWRGELSIDDDRFTPGLTELVQTVKQHGARIAIQLHHAGAQASRSITGVQAASPSGIPMSADGDPRELTIEEVGELVQRFAQAAQRAQRAGFDGVEIHAAHHYLISQFISSFFNKRSDVYGGEFKNRARFLVEIIGATRKLVGKEYPVWCRIDGEQLGAHADSGSDEMQQLARVVEDAGADAIDVSVSGKVYAVPPMTRPPDDLGKYAAAVKSAVAIPVIGGGGIDISTAAKIIEEGGADLMAVGRALIADPDLPNKASLGKEGAIRPCINCRMCLESIVFFQQPVRCTVNPAVGKEREYTVQKADYKKKVLVAGGGPAGMEAAITSALRGHDVILYEKEQRLGGQLLLASVPPHKDMLEAFPDFQRAELSRLGVRVELGKAVDAALIEQAGPDVAILATGAKPAVPDITGIHKPNVVTALDVLAGRVDVGSKVVVIGAEVVGCETAELLVDRGKDVTLLRRGEQVATKMSPMARGQLLARLSAKGVTTLTGVQYQEISDEGVTIITGDGEKQTIEAETIVLAAGSSPDIELRNALEGKVPEIHSVGDCVEPRNLLSAVTEGYSVALNI